MKEYGRDQEHNPPEWVEIIVRQDVIYKFIKYGKGVRWSSRRSLAATSTYLEQSEFDACRRLAQSILHPYHPALHPPQHWMDDWDTQGRDDDA